MLMKGTESQEYGNIKKHELSLGMPHLMKQRVSPDTDRPPHSNHDFNITLLPTDRTLRQKMDKHQYQTIRQ